MHVLARARPGAPLGRGHWQPLPSLPPVWHGWYAGAPAAAIGRSVYVLAHEFHGKLRLHNISGSSRLLRFTGSGWTVVPLPPAAGQGWTYFLTALDGGGLLAAGAGCPILECMEEVGRAAMITPGPRAHAIVLSAPADLGIPFPQGIAAGPRAVVVTYSAGGNTDCARRRTFPRSGDLRPAGRSVAARTTRPRHADRPFGLLDPVRCRVARPGRRLDAAPGCQTARDRRIIHHSQAGKVARSTSACNGARDFGNPPATRSSARHEARSCRIRAALFVARVRGRPCGRRHDHRRC